MKNLLKISSMMLLSIVFITSCSKKNEVLDIDGLKEKEISQPEMQNKDNLFDGQGKMFHGFLTILAKDVNIGGWDVGQLAKKNGGIGGWDVGELSQNNERGWDVGKLTTAAMDFNKNNGRDANDKAKRNLSMQLESFSNIAMANPIDDCLWRPDRCRMKKDAVAALSPTNGGTGHARTLKFINSLRDMEAEITRDDKMKDDEKRDILISLSIARHAAGYWYNQTLKEGKSNTNVSMTMIQLSSIGGASTPILLRDNGEIGVGIAILNAYIASGRAN